MSKFCISVEGPLVTSVKIGNESIPLNMPTEQFYNKYYSVIKDNVKDGGEIVSEEMLNNAFKRKEASKNKNSEASESRIYTPTSSIEESVLSVARAIVNGNLPKAYEDALRNKPELINDENFLKSLRCL